MLGLGPTEIIIVLFLVLLLFGSKKLPDLGGALGKSLKNFKEGIKKKIRTVELKQTYLNSVCNPLQPF